MSSNVRSEDHHSLNNFINFVTIQAGKKAEAISLVSNEFSELFNHVLTSKNVQPSDSNKTTDKLTAAATKIVPSQKITSTTKKQSTTTQSVLNNPNAAFVASGGSVVVTIQNSYSDYNNKIYWSTDNFKTRHYIGVDNKVGNHTIGVFPAGTPIEFGIDNGFDGFFRTGSAVNNSDGIVHALVNKSKGASIIRFEDMKNGGDWNFNDAVITVRNQPIPPAQKPQSDSDNSKTITSISNISNRYLWPIIDLWNQSAQEASSNDFLLDWLNLLVNLHSSTKNSRNCSTLNFYLFTQLTKLSISIGISYSDAHSIQQFQKIDTVISTVDIQWLNALHKS